MYLLVPFYCLLAPDLIKLKSIFLCPFKIQQKLQALMKEKENVYHQWQEKKEWLEKIHLEQMFYKDYNHLEKILNSQEVSELYIWCRSSCLKLTS